MFLAALHNPAWAQEPQYTIQVDVTVRLKSDNWRGVQSANFLVLGNVGDKQLRRIAVDLEELRKQVLKILPAALSGSGAGTTVVVFRNRKSLRLFEQPLGGTHSITAGHVQPGPDLNYIVLSADEKHRRALYHAYVRLNWRRT